MQVAFERDASFITDSDSTFTAASDQLEEILIDGSFGFSEECISLRNLLFSTTSRLRVKRWRTRVSQTPVRMSRSQHK